MSRRRPLQRPPASTGHRTQRMLAVFLVAAVVLSACGPAALPRVRVPTGAPARPTVAQTDGRGGPASANCARTSVGLTPLTDMGTATYQGFQGGLYPGGSNQPPADYLQIGLAHAQKIQPLNAAGRPDPVGSIVLLSIGMSNASIEYSAFQGIANRDPQKNPQVKIVNGAEFAQTADLMKDPNHPSWAHLDEKIAHAGVTKAQVQAIWLKQAINYETNPPASFPTDAQNLQSDLDAIIRNLQDRFPNLQLIYVSSRIYAGYASTRLNPEPYAYDSGFAVKWLIENNIKNKVYRPWVAWGPYLWADGTKPRSDGLVWTCQDLRPTDGTHPSEPIGAQKVAGLLLNFFKTDETAKSWFLKP